MNECEKFTGRLREICEGRAALPLKQVNAYRAVWGLALLSESDRPGERVASIAILAEPIAGKPGESHPRRMRGFGDLVSKVIKVVTFGKVKECGGCAGRRAALNKAIPFGRGG